MRKKGQKGMKMSAGMKMSVGIVCPDTWVYSLPPGWKVGVGEQ